MSKHEALIERLRASSEIGLDPDDAYAAAEALEAQAREIEGLRAARQAYASEFPPDNEGEPDVGSIHQNIRAMKAEIEGLRKDAERYRAFIDCGQPICFLGEEYFGKDALDAAIDAAKGGQHGAE